MNYAVIVGIIINGAGLLVGLYWVGVWVGNLNQTITTVRESLGKVSGDLEGLKSELKPRLNDLIRMEEAIRVTVEAVHSLQEIIRGAFSERLSTCERQIAEITIRCVERGHILDSITLHRRRDDADNG